MLVPDADVDHDGQQFADVANDRERRGRKEGAGAPREVRHGGA